MLFIKELNEEEIIKNKKKFQFFLKEAFESDFSKINISEEFIEKKYENLLDFSMNANTRIIGAYRKNELIGYLWCFFRENLGEITGHLNQIFVEKEYRGKGLAKLLFYEMEIFYLENNVKICDLYVTSSKKEVIEFYKKNDYVVERLYMIKRKD